MKGDDTRKGSKPLKGRSNTGKFSCKYVAPNGDIQKRNKRMEKPITGVGNINRGPYINHRITG